MGLPKQKKEVAVFTQALTKKSQTTLQVDGELRKRITEWRLENSGSQADVFRWGAELFLAVEEHLKALDEGHKLLRKRTKGEELASLVIHMMA